MDYSSCPRAGILQGNGKPGPSGKVAAGGYGQNHRRPGKFIECSRRNQHYRTSSLLLMARCQTQTYEPDFSTFHYMSSFPTGLESTQA